MKKTLIIVGAIALVVVIAVISVIGSYNSLVSLRENVRISYSAIQTQLQRRADLIPNLVNTVEGYNVQEKDVIEMITAARAQMAGASTATDLANADAALNSALSRLLVVVENYPDLKSSANFQQLMDELAGTENRVAVARNDYNTSVGTFNTKIQTFPTSIIAGIFGMTAQPYFEASEGSQTAPVVTFGQ